MKNNLTTRLAATAWCLSALLFAGCHNDNEPTQLLPPKGGIALTPSIGDIMPWNGGDDDASTRATTTATLAEGGVIDIMIYAVNANDEPIGDVLSSNSYTVTQDGKLERLKVGAGDDKDLHVPAPGKYSLVSSAKVELITDQLKYRAFAANENHVINIGGDGKISLPLVIKSGGIHVNLKGTDGTSAYAGNAVEVTLKTVGQTAEFEGGLETKTLIPQASSAIWGDLNTKDQSESVVAAGAVVMELKVDGKTYHVKASRQFTITEGRLYRFNVRVGATSISVNEPTIGDFETEGATNVEADYVKP